MKMRCVGCDRAPEDIPEYVAAGLAEGMTPADYVYEEEGTLNTRTGLFTCTECYVKIGMPTKPGGWTP